MVHFLLKQQNFFVSKRKVVNKAFRFKFWKKIYAPTKERLRLLSFYKKLWKKV